MKSFLLMLSTLAIIGCSNTSDMIVPEQKSNLTVGMIKSKIIEGKTTQSEVIELFGAPNIITTNSEGKEVWNYSKSSYQSGAQGKSSGWSVLLAGSSKSSVLSNASTASMDVIITFDKKGVVETYKVISSSF
jgi:outer membrane protein assembly factor BamE (lipoprotein component of BamABCDE complex)